MTVSPLAPAKFPTMPKIDGVRLSAIAGGLRYKGRPDLFLAEFAPGTQAAGVLTQSKTASAPVQRCRQSLKRGLGKRNKGLAIVVNAGNANAFTGASGWTAAEETAAATAKTLGIARDDVYLASTGVIGEALDGKKIAGLLAKLAKGLKPGNWHKAARAICTTDTFPKGACVVTEIGGKPVTIGGIAKGSGMIAPDMATMLSFIFTDAKIPAGVLQSLLRSANDQSFNAITVDSDTSTSDTCLLFATGKARHAKITKPGDSNLKAFKSALLGVMQDLAHQVVRDGEGATKFISITVSGAESKSAARLIARSIANSPLVKTAVAGADANWGRIVMAVGKSGERADRDRLVIAIGGIAITEGGRARPGYDEAPVAAHMKGREIDIRVDLGFGSGRATVWTCDLTHGYIDINADYRS